MVGGDRSQVLSDLGNIYEQPIAKDGQSRVRQERVIDSRPMDNAMQTYHGL